MDKVSSFLKKIEYNNINVLLIIVGKILKN